MEKTNKENSVGCYIKSNYHTHTFLCKHAIGDVDDYVRRAIHLGYEKIAITDHGPFPKFLQKKLHSRRMSFEQYDEVYLDHLSRAKVDHCKEILVLSGIEIEYMDELKPYYDKFLQDLDFLILGQHYIKIDDAYVNIFDQPLKKEEVEVYTNTVVDAMNSGMFKILAHPEIFSWNIRNWDEICDEASEKIIDAAIKNNVILEINVNGIRNAYYQGKEMKGENGINFPYPRLEFWRLVEKKGALAMINDDAHAPNRICDEYTLMVYKSVLNHSKLKVVSTLDIKDNQTAILNKMNV